MWWGQTVRAEALTLAMEPWFPVGLNGWSAGPGLLLWTCWVAGDFCSSRSCCWATLCYSLITLSSDVSAPSQPCLGWLWSHFALLVGHRCLSVLRFHCTDEVRASISLFLWGRKHLTCVHTAWFRDQVLWHPICTEKMNQDVAASVSHRSGKTTGGWWKIRDDLSAARSYVCSFLQGREHGWRCSIWISWV